MRKRRSPRLDPYSAARYRTNLTQRSVDQHSIQRREFITQQLASSLADFSGLLASNRRRLRALELSTLGSGSPLTQPLRSLTSSRLVLSSICYLGWSLVIVWPVAGTAELGCAIHITCEHHQSSRFCERHRVSPTPSAECRAQTPPSAYSRIHTCPACRFYGLPGNPRVLPSPTLACGALKRTPSRSQRSFSSRLRLVDCSKKLQWLSNVQNATLKRKEL